MSLCDRCYAPGACCKGFTLFRENRDEVTLWLDEPFDDQMSTHGVPFAARAVGEPILDETGRPFTRVKFDCRRLSNGRCADYESRPEVCRNFEAGSGSLCVHFDGAESGDGSAEFGRL